MPTAHILVVEDDALLRRRLIQSLEQAGYRVTPEDNAEDALAQARLSPPDLVLLDIGLPGMDGLQAVRFFSDLGSPVIFLTGRRRELDEVLGLELGADDYITKPFTEDIVLAHIKAVLRRAERSSLPGPKEPQRLVVGDLIIDAAAHSVTAGGRLVDLTPREFDLLYCLALEAGHALSVDDLLARVWGPDYQGEPQAVYVHIRWLRKKLEDDLHRPRQILNVRGVGYKLEPLGSTPSE